jgi:signal transduction histidine kinase
MTPTQQGLVLIGLVMLASRMSPSFWTTVWLGAALISREALIAQERERAHRQALAFAAQTEELTAIQERTRIARELHDGVCRALNTASMQLAACEEALAHDPRRAADELARAQRLVADGQAEARQTIYALRDTSTLMQPLPELLQPLIDELRAAGVATTLDVVGTPRVLHPHTTAELVRIVQEGLTNIRKHARATTAQVRLDYRSAATLRLTIRDTGQGAVQTDGGLGIPGMHERVHVLGGTIELRTAPNQGFVITVEVPG